MQSTILHPVNVKSHVFSYTPVMNIATVKKESLRSVRVYCI